MRSRTFRTTGSGRGRLTSFVMDSLKLEENRVREKALRSIRIRRAAGIRFPLLVMIVTFVSSCWGSSRMLLEVDDNARGVGHICG